MTEKLFNEYEIKNELQKIEQWKLVIKSGGLIPPYENLPDDNFVVYIPEGLNNTERFEAPPSDELPDDNFVVYIPEGLNNTERFEAPPSDELPDDNFVVYIPEGLNNTERFEAPPSDELPGDDFVVYIPEGLNNTERFEAPPSDELPGDDFVVYIPEGLNNTELREEPPAEELAGENLGINWSSDTTEDVEGKNLALEGIDLRAEHDNYFGDTSTLVNAWESHGWSNTDPLNANDNNINSNFEDDFSGFKWTSLTDDTQLHDAEAIGLESSSLETNLLNDGLTKDLTEILTDNVGALCCPGGTSY